MSAATCLSDPTAAAGSVDLAFENRDGRTCLSTLFQQAPLRVLFPNSEAANAPTAVVATIGGGVVGGDRLDVAVLAGARTSAVVTAQAAEKIYRSTGAMSRINVRLTCETGAWLEWVPQETIVFDRARIRRTTTVIAQTDAKILAGDIVVFGRQASGERLTRASIGDTWSVTVGGRRVWADQFCLDGDIAGPLNGRGSLGGAVAVATVVYVGQDAPALLPLVRNLTENDAEPPVRAGASIVGGVLIVRWLAWDTIRLRAAFALTWTALRHHASGMDPAMPRIWSI